MENIESLKRVLTELKGEARNMRAAQLKKRLSGPKKEEEVMSDKSEGESSEEITKETPSEEPTEETKVGDGSEGPEPKGAEKKEGDEEEKEEGEAVDPDVAKVLAKHGLG